MRFLVRATTGCAILALSIGFLALGFQPYWGCLPGLQGAAGLACAFDRPERRAPAASAERSFVVRAEILRPETLEPELMAFGEIRAGRRLELRAPLEGRLVEIAPVFRDGARVRAGDILFRIDRADAASARDDAVAAQLEADAELAEARQALALAEAETAAAIGQRALRQAALERLQGLSTRGFSTDADVEAAELALAEAERAVLTRAQAEATAARRVAQGEQQVTRAALSVADAERALADATLVAPFDGVLDGVDAALGRRVAVNEALGALIDPTDLEAAFRISNREFARLLDAEGALAPALVTVSLDLGDRTVTTSGRLDRIGAQVAMTEGGRRIFARLDRPAGDAARRTLLRPGDFVEIRIAEPPLTDVAIVPAAALDTEGRLLIIGEEDRLEAVPVRIVRRLGDQAAVDGAPFGARFVTAPGPQLGPGVKVRIENDARQDATDATDATGALDSGEDAATGPRAAAPAPTRAR